MTNEQASKLLSDLVSLYYQVTQTASDLTSEQLEAVVPFGRSERQKRSILYGIGDHMREHSVHIQKLLQKTGAPGAMPTESQNIMGVNNAALAAYISAFSLVTDQDLDKEFEGTTPRKIMEHVSYALNFYAQGLKK